MGALLGTQSHQGARTRLMDAADPSAEWTVWMAGSGPELDSCPLSRHCAPQGDQAFVAEPCLPLPC